MGNGQFMKALSNRVIVIVGAGGRIGQTAAIRFAREGAHLILGDIASAPLEASLKAVRAEGVRAEGVTVDVVNPAQVEGLVDKAVRVHGTLDALVNCVAVQEPIGLSWENDVQAWKKAVDVNLLGTWHCARFALPVMVAKKKGKLVLFSGGGAAYARPHFSAYGSTKTAVVRLCETLAEELKPYHVQVNAVAPGPVKSGMTEEVLNAGRRAGDKALQEAKEIWETGGTPVEKYTGLLTYLVSEASGALTGKLIHVNDPWQDQKMEAMHDELFKLRRMNPAK